MGTCGFFRRPIFGYLHPIFRPVFPSLLPKQLLTDLFVWPGMRKDIRNWASDAVNSRKLIITLLLLLAHVLYPIVVLNTSKLTDLALWLRSSVLCTCLLMLIVFPVGFTLFPPRPFHLNRWCQRSWRLGLLGCECIIAAACHSDSNGLVECFHHQLIVVILAT